MREVHISVDVETTGSVPGIYSMYELGACLVDDVTQHFSAEIELLNLHSEPDALSSCGRTIEELIARKCEAPIVIMRRFGEWVRAVSAGGKPIFVGFNAPFDWMFVHWYFHAFAGGSPFGAAAAMDIKAYYAGMTDCSWEDTKSSRIDPRFHSTKRHTHRALDDAIEQAEMFRKMRAANAQAHSMRP